MDYSSPDYDSLSEDEIFQKFYAIVKRIPEGKVGTYGQVAEMAGRPGDARNVGHALSGSSKIDIPWHRVVSASGEIAMVVRSELRDRQKDLLLQEGVEFIDEYQVDMKRFDWQAKQQDLFG
ncbi:MGMT family protein [Agarilytica rhodophyticola]|uniref:MGMT family protein n=1 Tax=Agarilytica rhodophyticola TaxID=1737490 RepID=UPI000B349212|nr:MGMT family protein [Agarilytica rhodophyticola]